MRAFSFLLCALAGSVAGADILTQRGDNQRTAVNRDEQLLNPGSVKAHFGKLWTLFSDAKIMAQPLYVSMMKSDTCPAGCNTVIFCSINGTVYAYKADQKPTTSNDTLVWARYLGDPRDGGDDIDAWATDDPWWGILGTPVIDAGSRLLYAAAWNKDNNYRLSALDLQNGQVRKGPVVIQGSVTANGQKTAFFSGAPGAKQTRKQRAALLLDHGLLYVAFGGDTNGMAGWLFVYDAATLMLKTVWSPVPGGPNGGIWMSGTGPLADTDGSIYLQTANGDFNPAGNHFGNGLLHLRFDGSNLQVVDFFAPCGTSFQNGQDLDLGSAGPLFLPGNLILGGGKTGVLYLMDRAHLGKFQAGASAACQDGNLVTQRIPITGGHIHGTPVSWSDSNAAWVYVMGEGDNLNAIPFRNSRLQTGPGEVRKSAWRPPKPAPVACGGAVDNWMPGGILSVSSDGPKPGTGIVWVLSPANGDANSFRGVKGMLMAFDAADVSQELWRSQAANPATDTADSFGLLSRFVPPTVANGKVFVAASGDQEPLKRYEGFHGAGPPPCGNRPTQFPANFALAVYGLK
jgi:hypothetical protein